MLKEVFTEGNYITTGMQWWVLDNLVSVNKPNKKNSVSRIQNVD
jgi:hypothetical protein